MLLRWLAQGFKEGFHIPYEGPCVSVMSRNLKSINGLVDVVRRLERSWRAAISWVPTTSCHCATYVSHLLGVVPKKAPREFSLIIITYPTQGGVQLMLLLTLSIVLLSMHHLIQL